LVDKTRVVIAEDNADLCKLLVLIVNAEVDMRCVGATASLADITAIVNAEAAPVLILDNELQGESGLRALQGIRAACPQLAVIMHTGHAHPQLAQQALSSGAAGYVAKSGDLDELLAAVRAAARSRL